MFSTKHKVLLGNPNILIENPNYAWEVPIKPKKTQILEEVLGEYLANLSKDFLRNLSFFGVLAPPTQNVGFQIKLWDRPSKNQCFAHPVGNPLDSPKTVSGI